MASKQSPYAKRQTGRGKSSPSTTQKSQSTRISSTSIKHDLLPMELPVQMSSPPAGHAKTSAWLEKALASGESEADYSAKSSGSLASYDPNTSSWKTSQLCLDGDYQTFSDVWPRRGMMRNGIASRLPTLGPGINGTEYGYLPTPDASAMGKGSPADRYYGSPTYRGLLREYLRDGPDDPIYPDPNLVEALMGYPDDWTA